MADPRGFLKVRERELPPRRPVSLRLMDWREVYEQQDRAELRRQAGRCMDCGIPFCHQGCPLGNLIPEWNDFVHHGEGRLAIERLHATNNFPEFTGKLCPAPCESSCVLGINQPAVTIKQVEASIVEQAFANGWVEPHPPQRLTGKTVAVVGSGPAGLAAAQQLTRAGHTVAVYERDDRIGGLLRYGIPEFKMEKHHLETRLNQMLAEGTRFRAGVEIGVDISWPELRSRYDAVVVATGAPVPRDLPVPGRDLEGIHFAMEYLVRANKAVAGDEDPGPLSAEDRIGGLMRYGIPEFKMEKHHLETRLNQMLAEGTRFRAGVEIGVDISWPELRSRYDAVVVATGAPVPRDLPVPGRDLDGIHFAMEYLVRANKVVAGDEDAGHLSAEDRHVVVIGGGDTGADCIGSAHRQGAASVTNLAIGRQPPLTRSDSQPWPMVPTVFETSSAHEEGGRREFLASTVEFVGDDDGRVRAVRVAETEYVDGRRVPRAGTERELRADLVLIAMGFTGPEQGALGQQLGLPFDASGALVRGDGWQTAEPGVFVAGDAGRGQSLIVWAIAEGRSVAAAVDAHLEGSTELPAPVAPGDRAIALA